MSNLAKIVFDPTAERPARPRRWIPLSLRMFVGLLLLLGLGSLLWIGPQGWRQYVAIQAIEGAGGVVGTSEIGPRWLAQWIGYCQARLFEQADWIAFGPPFTTARAMATDETLEQLTKLRSLRKLGLTGTRVTDRGLANLKTLTALNWIGLGSTEITGAGLVHLQALPVLEGLSLRHVEMTDGGFAQLRSIDYRQMLDRQRREY